MEEAQSHPWISTIEQDLKDNKTLKKNNGGGSKEDEEEIEFSKSVISNLSSFTHKKRLEKIALEVFVYHFVIV